MTEVVWNSTAKVTRGQEDNIIMDEELVIKLKSIFGPKQKKNSFKKFKSGSRRRKSGHDLDFPTEVTVPSRLDYIDPNDNIGEHFFDQFNEIVDKPQTIGKMSN